MLKVDQLNQFYGESHTLWDLNLHVPEGQVTVLMGRNGVGKTTLLQCIMGLLKVRDGAIAYQDQNLVNVDAEKRANLGIGYVPQGRQIFPLLTVEENLLSIVEEAVLLALWRIDQAGLRVEIDVGRLSFAAPYPAHRRHERFAVLTVRRIAVTATNQHNAQNGRGEKDGSDQKFHCYALIIRQNIIMA